MEVGGANMKCSAMQDLMFRKLDNELSESEHRILDEHLDQCAVCAREYGLLTVPQRIAQAISPPESSPFFLQTLRARIESESQNAAIFQLFFGLARRIIPSMAAVTLVLLSVFAYLQLSNPQDDLHTAYEKMLTGADLPFPLIVSEQKNITDENIISAIANRGIWQGTNLKPKQQ